MLRVPDWCKKRIRPSLVRIYDFASTESWLMHENLCKSLGREIGPSASRYTLSEVRQLDLDAYAFQKQIRTTPVEELLNVHLGLHQVVEVFDGVQSVILYKTPQIQRRKTMKNNFTISQRNAIVENHLWCIKTVMKQNRALIRAAKLDTDDVYQQLALRLIRAVMSYDPEKGNLEQHIFAQLRMELQKTAHSNVISLDAYRMRDAA